MSLSCGFYNSVNHDRRYDATQFGRLIDCLIKDGIFMHIGDKMVVTAHEDHIEIGSGLAWFDSTWSYNDSAYIMTLPKSDVVYSRIDAVVLEINSEEDVRTNTFKFIEGTAASTPAKPTLINNDTIHQYALCYITRAANVEIISQAVVENAVGTDSTPFVSGILETVSISNLLVQWETEFDQWMQGEKADYTEWSAAQKDQFNTWMQEQEVDFATWTDEKQQAFDTMLETDQAAFDQWNAGLNQAFNEWFAGVKDTLDGNTAGNLLLRINREEVERILTAGFIDGTKTISDDGRSIITVTSDGRRLEKQFNEDFSVLITTYKTNATTVVAIQTKTFDSSGKVITTEVSFT